MGGDFRAYAIAFVTPPMIGALDAAVMDAPMRQRCPTVYANITDAVDFTGTVAKEREAPRATVHRSRRLLSVQMKGQSSRPAALHDSPAGASRAPQHEGQWSGACSVAQAAMPAGPRPRQEC